MRISPWLFISSLVHIRAYCPASVLSGMPFVLEYALWRGWQQALFFTPSLERGCEWSMVRLVKCLNVNGIGAAVIKTFDSQPVRVQARLGIVLLTPMLKDNRTEAFATLLQQLSKSEVNKAFYDWLITTRTDLDLKKINALLNETSVRFDQNLVVSYPWKTKNKTLDLCNQNFVYKPIPHSNVHREACRYSKDPYCARNEYEKNYFSTSERFRNLTKRSTYVTNGKVFPLYQSGLLYFNDSRPFLMTNMTEFSLKSKFLSFWRYNNKLAADSVHLVQYFKVRHNSTLYGYFLGTWDRRQSMANVEVPYPVEARNFLGEVLVVGRCNSSADGTLKLDDDGPSSPVLLDDTLLFLTVRLNATPTSRYFSQLGFQTYDGGWTGLLGALVDRSVDVALEPVTAHAPRHRHMDFVFPIAETMCNIYIRHQETSTVRDIFLAPFSPRLLACVGAVALAAAAAAALTSRVSVHRHARRPLDYAEALLWSTGILCQQGGNWTPTSPAASGLLIVCLLFAVVTYNAYAAFITSVLSVRVPSVDTAAAVLTSTDFKIGYVRNGADQMYLMSTKDAMLNTFYIRGYSDADNLVSTTEEGLARAAHSDYAFFAGQRAARSTLRALSQARGRCALRELPVPSTRAQLAIPLPRNSPYARPALVSLLQLRSGGVMSRLGTALVPPMPQCEPPTGFASARATDVRSALILIAVGLISAAVLGVAEYSWKNRRPIWKMFKKYGSRILTLIE